MLQDDRILHSWLVVGCLERRRLVDEHHRNHVLQADVRHVAVVHHASATDADGQLLHLVRLEGVALLEQLQRIERRLNRRSHAPFLDVRAHQFEALAQFVDEPVGIGAGRVREQEVVVAREDVVDAVPPGVDQEGRRHATACRHAAKGERLLDVIGVA